MTKRHRFKIDKLIRDKYASMNRGARAKALTRVMEHDEYVQRLKDKLFEEAHEVRNASSAKEIKEELADVYEVIITIASVHGIEFQDIIKEAERKRLEKGGFDGKIYMEYLELKQDHHDLWYFKANPKKYPEIEQS